MYNNSDYDTNIMINNIKKLMEKEGFSQENIAKAVGTTQGRISKILSGDGCFTVPQLVAVAKLFNVSVDSILGIEAPTPSRSNSVADVYSKLFELDQLLSLDIREYLIADNSIYGDCNYYIPCILLDEPYSEKYSGFLREWKQIKEISLENAELKEEIYAGWKSRRIEDAEKSTNHFHE